LRQSQGLFGAPTQGVFSSSAPFEQAAKANKVTAIKNKFFMGRLCANKKIIQ
jgi:hypothetical protein